MWVIIIEEKVSKKLPKFKDQWPHEMGNVLDNLTAVVDKLNDGTAPEQLKKFGFVQSEPSNLLAINQKGPGKKTRMKVLRLYVYPDKEKQKLWLITLGDKSEQAKDIKYAKHRVKEITQAD